MASRSGSIAWAKSCPASATRSKPSLALGATRWEAAQPADPPGRQDGLDPDHQRHDGRRDRQPPRHDDRPAPRRHQPGRGGQVSDRDHVPDRFGTALGTVSVVLLSYRRLFNEDHQFLDATTHRPRSRTRRSIGTNSGEKWRWTQEREYSWRVRIIVYIKAVQSRAHRRREGSLIGMRRRLEKHDDIVE